MRFTCYLNIGFNLKIFKWAQNCLHDVTQESVAAWTYHSVDAFGVKMLRVAMTL